MPKDEPCFWMPVENTPKEYPNSVASYFGAPCPGCSAQLRKPVEQVPFICLWRTGVNLERHVEFFLGVPHWFELWLVQIVPVGVVVHQGSTKAKLMDATM